MRHGERADFAGGFEKLGKDTYNSCIPHDPPLTAKGIEQAEHAGKYINERLKTIEIEYGVKFNEVYVESSPFLRCLQTSSRVAKAISQ